MVDFNRKRRLDRPRQRAILTLATLTLGWILYYEVDSRWDDQPSTDLTRPPQFFVDLQSADESELQLLPNVGKKTAHAWRETLDSAPASPPRHAQELEGLPYVGPIRSSQLSPYLVESEQ